MKTTKDFKDLKGMQGMKDMKQYTQKLNRHLAAMGERVEVWDAIAAAAGDSDLLDRPYQLPATAARPPGRRALRYAALAACAAVIVTAALTLVYTLSSGGFGPVGSGTSGPAATARTTGTTDTTGATAAPWSGPLSETEARKIIGDYFNMVGIYFGHPGGFFQYIGMSDHYFYGGETGVSLADYKAVMLQYVSEAVFWRDFMYGYTVEDGMIIDNDNGATGYTTDIIAIEYIGDYRYRLTLQGNWPGSEEMTEEERRAAWYEATLGVMATFEDPSRYVVSTSLNPYWMEDSPLTYEAAEELLSRYIALSDARYASSGRLLVETGLITEQELAENGAAGKSGLPGAYTGVRYDEFKGYMTRYLSEALFDEWFDSLYILHTDGTILDRGTGTNGSRSRILRTVSFKTMWDGRLGVYAEFVWKNTAETVNGATDSLYVNLNEVNGKYVINEVYPKGY